MSNQSTIDLVITNQVTTITRTDRIINTMVREIEKHGFGVLQRYPNDIEIDKRIISQFEGSSGTLAWCLGDTHTHLVALGLHQEENSLITCFLNLSSSDKFYKIVLNGTEDFKLIELKREQFAELEHFPIAYKVTANNLAFTVSCNEKPIAMGEIKGGRNHATQKLEYTANVHALASLSIIQKIAVRTHAYHVAKNYCCTLFFSLNCVV